MGAEAQLDDGAGVGHQFGLPAVVGLELLHGCFGLRIPVAACLAGEIAGLNEGALNLGCTAVIDGALTGVFRGWLGVLARRSGTTAGMG